MRVEFQPIGWPCRPDWPSRRVDLWWCTRRPRERSAPWLRELLGAYLERPADAVTLVRGPHGRPELADGEGTGLRFSLSHSRDRLLCAVSAGATPGLDLERLRPRPRALALARRYFTVAESAALQALPPPRRELAFYRLWTGREAVLKATGRGLGFGLDRLRLRCAPSLRLDWLDGDDAGAWQLHAFEPGPQWVAAVAWRGRPLPLAGWEPVGDRSARR